MKVCRIFEVDVRRSFDDAEIRVNEELLKLQKKGNKILGAPKIFERASGFVIVEIFYVINEKLDRDSKENKDGSKSKKKKDEK